VRFIYNIYLKLRYNSFGENPLIYSKYFGLKGHNGLDLATFWRDKVYAPYDALVVDVKTTDSGYGKHVYLCDDKYLTVYGHLDEVVVKIGEKVKQGDVIGFEGNTGAVLKDGKPQTIYEDGIHFGTHLHWGVYKVAIGKAGRQKYFPAIKKVYTILNYYNGYRGAIDPLPLVAIDPLPLVKIEKQEIMTREKLYQIFHEIVLREPTPEEVKIFESYSEDRLREFLGKTALRKKIIKFVNFGRMIGYIKESLTDN